MGKGKTQKADFWRSEVNKYTEIIDTFNRSINDPNAVYEIHRKDIKKNPGKMRDDINVVRVYRRLKDEIVHRDYKPGELVTWKAGDLVKINPKQLVAGYEGTQRNRKAMHHAFARKDQRLTDLDMLRLDQLLIEFSNALKDNQIIDPTRPKDSQRFGISSERDLAILMDYLAKAVSLNPHHTEVVQQQFLHMLLTPKARDNIFSVVGLAPNGKDLNTMVTFANNKYNESLVFQFLQRAMEGNASRIVEADIAKDWHQTINDRFKTSFLREWDPSLQGDMFRYERLIREMNDFRILPKLKELPSFVMNTDLNQRAVSTMEGYLMGHYFLSPFEAYRVTVDMTVKGLDSAPPAQRMNEIVKGLWTRTERRAYEGGNLYDPAHSFRSQIYHGTESGKGTAVDWLRQQRNKCF